MEMKRLKEEIEIQRLKLNKIVVGSKSKSQIIEVSKELDILINKYYSIDLNKKIAE